MNISIDDTNVAVIQCTVHRAYVGHHGTIAYNVRISGSSVNGLTYNGACVKLFDVLSGMVTDGTRIGAAVFGTLRYRRPQDLRRQICRAMILSRDLRVDSSQTRDEIGDPALDEEVNDIGDDGIDWIEEDEDLRPPQQCTVQ
jgi:hypothetical protein